MNDLSEKERLLRSLRGQSVDRKPVICPGGMMNAAIVEVVEASGASLPAGHEQAEAMAGIASAVRSLTGFENLGLPFCLTVEPGALGSSVDLGTAISEPKIAAEAYASVAEVRFLPAAQLAQNSRVQTVLSAIATLAASHPDSALIGSISGPVTTAASLVEPQSFFKELRKRPAEAHRLLSYVSERLADFAALQIEAGASLIAISDPTATGEILGPQLFGEYALPYLNELVLSIQKLGRPVILHICGRLSAVEHLLDQLRADALSTDSLVNLERLKQRYPQLVTMGNLSTELLHSSTPAAIERYGERLRKSNIDILAPACGLGTTTPLANIAAFTGAIRQ
jgi:[methyl-Co(III) methanol-specific corrinoid protein]:coenzyme M methyltransferase